MIRRLTLIAIVATVFVLSTISFIGVYRAIAQTTVDEAPDAKTVIDTDTPMSLGLVAVLFSAACSVVATSWAVKVLWNKVDKLTTNYDLIMQQTISLQATLNNHNNDDQLHTPRSDVMTMMRWERERQEMREEDKAQREALIREFSLKLEVAIGELKSWIKENGK